MKTETNGRWRNYPFKRFELERKNPSLFLAIVFSEASSCRTRRKVIKISKEINVWVCLCVREWSVQFSHSVMSDSLQPMDCSKPGFPVLHQLLELAQTHVHWVSDAIQPSHPLSSPFLPAFNLSQHQDLLLRVYSIHQVAKVLKLQLQHQSFQWLFRTEFL